MKNVAFGFFEKLLTLLLSFALIFTLFTPLAFARESYYGSPQNLFSQDENYPLDNREKIFGDLLRQTRGEEFTALLERLFGNETSAATQAFAESSAQLIKIVTDGASGKAEERLDEQIRARQERPKTITTPLTPRTKTNPAGKPAVRSKKVSLNFQPQFDWRQLAFGFQTLPLAATQQQQEEKPEVKLTETDKEINAEGENKKLSRRKKPKARRPKKPKPSISRTAKLSAWKSKSRKSSKPFQSPTEKVSGRKCRCLGAQRLPPVPTRTAFRQEAEKRKSSQKPPTPRAA